MAVALRLYGGKLMIFMSMTPHVLPQYSACTLYLRGRGLFFSELSDKRALALSVEESVSRPVHPPCSSPQVKPVTGQVMKNIHLYKKNNNINAKVMI